HSRSTYHGLSNLVFLFNFCGSQQLIPSFPTRRSSDLLPEGRRLPSVQRVAHLALGEDAARERVHAEELDPVGHLRGEAHEERREDRKSTRLNSSHVKISYAVFCLKKKTKLRGLTGIES